MQADVNAGTDNEAAVANVVKQAIDTFGRIDVLINNAQASASGVSLRGPHNRTVQSRIIFWIICRILLHESILSIFKRNKGICY